MALLSFPHASVPSHAPLAGAWTLLARTVDLWRRRAHERRELGILDHRTIRDLGLSPGEVQFEASKPFWRD